MRPALVALALLPLLPSMTGCPTEDPPPVDTDTAVQQDTVADTTADVPTADTPADPGVDAGPVTLAGPCSLATRYGGFLVQSDDLFGYVDGAVSNGVIPVTILEEVGVEGDCKLLKRNNPFCSPPCGPGDTCDFDGSCITFPEPQDLGTVTLDGLVDGTISMDPVQPGNTYFNTSVPNPPFAPGAALTLRTGASGTWGAQVLHGVGFEPLSLGTDTEWSVAQATPLTITWTPPSDTESPARVALMLNIDQHGNSPYNLVCEFDDTGSAEIPASLIDQLLTAGVSGFPNGSLTRRTVDSAQVGDGCMEFVVGALAVPDVRVTGHTPCNSTNDCPSGQTCNVPINTCE